MADTYNIQLSDPEEKEYNVIRPTVGDDINLDVPTESSWASNSYSITLYDSAGSTVATNLADADGTTTLGINSFSEDNGKYDLVVEDRQNLSNIQRIDTIGYVFFRKFPQPATVTSTKAGDVIYEQADGTELNIAYYTTGYS